MLKVKKSSPLIDAKKYKNKIYSEKSHEIYYLADNKNDELLFLYKNLKFDFNNIEKEVKVFSDKDFNKMNQCNSNNTPAFFVLDHFYDYNIGGYPLLFTRIRNNLYQITYGNFNNIGEQDDINNSYGKSIKANSIFIKESLNYLFQLFPDIEIFDTIADFRISNYINVDDPEIDFKRRVNFFKKNNFLILTKTNQDDVKESKYYKTIVKRIKNRSESSFIYMNKYIFDLK